MGTTKSLKGTKTEINLANAYVAESTAVTRYIFYGQQADKEGYHQYATLFKETSDNELHHAKIFLRYLTEGGVTTAPVAVDPGVIGPTSHDLAIAAAEEEKEGVEQYTNAAKDAEAEGFTEIAARFRAIATIEAHHMARFNKMRQRIEEGSVWKRDTPIKWQCQVCGYIFEGVQPPEKCPACYHPYQYFMPEEDNI